MEINLRKANALQNAIQEAVRAFTFDVNVEINEFQSPEEEIEKANIEWYNQFARREALLDAIYDIRRKVAAANFESGISVTLANVARVEKDIDFLSKLVVTEPRVEEKVLRGKLLKIREADTSNSMYSMRTPSIDTTIFNEEELQGFRKKIAESKKLKQKFQDNLLEANIETKISLDTATVVALEQENLI